jgi:hypothetical protein
MRNVSESSAFKAIENSSSALLRKDAPEHGINQAVDQILA